MTTIVWPRMYCGVPKNRAAEEPAEHFGLGFPRDGRQADTFVHGASLAQVGHGRPHALEELLVPPAVGDVDVREPFVVGLELRSPIDPRGARRDYDLERGCLERHRPQA